MRWADPSSDAQDLTSPAGRCWLGPPSTPTPGGPQSPPPSASSTHFSHSPSFCPFSPSPISFKGMFVVLPCLPPLSLSFQSVHNPQTIAKRNKRSVIHKTTYFPPEKSLRFHSFHRKLMSPTPPNGRNKSELRVFLRSKENRKRKNVAPRRSLITIGVL